MTSKLIASYKHIKSIEVNVRLFGKKHT